MYELISTRFYWPNIWKDIYTYTASCNGCLKYKVNSHPSKGELRFSSCPPNVCDEWELDFCGPFERSSNGNEYILTATDRLSRYLVVKATRNQTEATVIKFLRESLFTTFGYPNVIKTDNGPAFRGKELSSWLERIRIGHQRSASYDSESQALVERVQGTYQNLLRVLVGEKKKSWESYLLPVVHIYNSTVHSSTKLSPYLLMFGREPNLASTIGLPNPLSSTPDEQEDAVSKLAAFRLNVKQRIEIEQELRLRTNSRRQITKFSVGDWVLIETPKRSRDKLDPLFKGPYEVVNVWDNDNYTLVLTESKEAAKPKFVTVHVSLMRKHPTNQITPVPVAEQENQIEDSKEQSDLRRSKRVRNQPRRLDPSK